MFLVMAKLMWGFEIEAEEKGQKMDVDKAWTPGFLTKPSPFKARFTVRSDKHAAVIRKEWKDEEKNVDVLLDQVQERRTGVRDR